MEKTFRVYHIYMYDFYVYEVHEESSKPLRKGIISKFSSRRNTILKIYDCTSKKTVYIPAKNIDHIEYVGLRKAENSNGSED